MLERRELLKGLACAMALGATFKAGDAFAKEPDPKKDPKKEPAKTESKKAKPAKAEPKKSEPAKAAPKNDPKNDSKGAPK